MNLNTRRKIGLPLMLISVLTAALLLALAVFGEGYRALGIVLLPVGLWFNLRHQPAQREIRPAIRVLGWIFIGLAVVAAIASVIAITSHR
jgi:ABC-type spermidine/putrescine transport system permease subunit II